MRTNYVPAMVMLSAGFVHCVIGFTKHMSLMDFTKQLLIVLIAFFIIGCIVRAILDKAMVAMADKEETSEEAQEDEKDQDSADTKDE